MTYELFGALDSDSETEEKLAYFSGNCYKRVSKQACKYFLCYQCMTMDRDILRWIEMVRGRWGYIELDIHIYISIYLYLYLSISLNIYQYLSIYQLTYIDR